ncbi:MULTISPECIES: hypothetical protein [Vibrio]
MRHCYLCKRLMRMAMSRSTGEKYIHYLLMHCLPISLPEFKRSQRRKQ